MLANNREIKMETRLLTKLIGKCKASVIVTANEHRDNYQTVEDYFNEIEQQRDDDLRGDIETEVYNKMVKTDTIIEVHFYPNTPIGFYQVFHYDVELALKEALKISEGGL